MVALLAGDFTPEDRALIGPGDTDRTDGLGVGVGKIFLISEPRT